MKNLILTIGLDNDSFGEDPENNPQEVVRILREYCARMESMHCVDVDLPLDANGNSVMHWEIVEKVRGIWKQQ